MANEKFEIKAGFGCYLTLDLIEKLDERAKEEGRSRNNVIERLLQAALDAEIST